MRTNDLLGGLRVATLLVTCTAVIGLLPLKQYVPKRPAPNPPDTTGFWQQANTAKQIECRDLVLAEVLRMKLPAEAYTDPALAIAMQQGRELCLLKNKVLI